MGHQTQTGVPFPDPWARANHTNRNDRLDEMVRVRGVVSFQFPHPQLMVRPEMLLEELPYPCPWVRCDVGMERASSPKTFCSRFLESGLPAISLVIEPALRSNNVSDDSTDGAIMHHGAHSVVACTYAVQRPALRSDSELQRTANSGRALYPGGESA
jgi:hypothetical protein